MYSRSFFLTAFASGVGALRRAYPALYRPDDVVREQLHETRRDVVPLLLVALREQVDGGLRDAVALKLLRAHGTGNLVEELRQELVQLDEVLDAGFNLHRHRGEPRRDDGDVPQHRQLEPVDPGLLALHEHLPRHLQAVDALVACAVEDVGELVDFTSDALAPHEGAVGLLE